MIEVEEHLGGGEVRCWEDEGTLDWAIQTFNVKSMIDIGCGQACQVKLAREKGLEAIGIDADPRVLTPDLHIKHDFAKEKFSIDQKFDLAWSCEFLEHVYEEYIPNYMPAFQSAKIVICTHAPPGRPGTHHVNCQTPDYWKDVFYQYGFRWDEQGTQMIRQRTTMGKAFMRKYGLLFIKQ